MQQKTKEEKEELVQLYKQSGMSVRAFAQEFDIMQHSENGFIRNRRCQQLKITAVILLK